MANDINASFRREGEQPACTVRPHVPRRQQVARQRQALSTFPIGNVDLCEMARTEGSLPGLLTAIEAGDLLRLAPASIYRRVRNGDLRALKVGEHGPLRFRPEDIERLLRPALPPSEGENHP